MANEPAVAIPDLRSPVSCARIGSDSTEIDNEDTGKENKTQETEESRVGKKKRKRQRIRANSTGGTARADAHRYGREQELARGVRVPAAALLPSFSASRMWL